MVQYKELQVKYDTILKGESAEMESFAKKLQEFVFDYFNLIVKEYYLSIDHYSLEMEYK